MERVVAAAFSPHFFIILFVSAVLCAIGFYKFFYFMSVGYGAAILGAGVAILAMFGSNISASSIVLCILLILYGLRLSGFLVLREIRSASYRKSMVATGSEKKMPFVLKTVIWISVSVLYALQVSPILYRQINMNKSITLPIIGAIIMALGLTIETIADIQKSKAKRQSPNRFCDIGLYRMVRCPNYFGEIVFWTGVFISGLDAIVGWRQWVVAILGYVLIFYVMLSGANRLEKRQNKNYGCDKEYIKYSTTTPILFPLIPWYKF